MMVLKKRTDLVGFLVVCLVALPGIVAAQNEIELVSYNRRGFTADGPSQGSVVSGNGRYVAFFSDAKDMGALNDRNGVRDVFVRDRVTGAIEVISIGLGGAEANGPSQPGASSPGISDDGCFVAFSSSASNLVDGDGNDLEDVFVRDRCAGQTERVSVAPGGGDANGTSRVPGISGDGRYVVFQSKASNLIAEDNNGASDVFVYDRQTGEMRRASVADLSGEEGNADSLIPSISGNGRVVAFESLASNLVAGTNGNRQVFVHELDTGRTELVSVNASGKPGAGQSFYPSLDMDGSVVAFKSEASDLVPGDTNGVADVFVRDRETGDLERISLDNFGNQARSLSAHPRVSADGRYVTFPSYDDFFDPEDGNRQSDVFVVDRLAEPGSRIARVSVEPRPPSDGGVPEAPPGISANGKWVSFATASTKFVPPDIDNNNAYDVFVTCNPLDLPCECLTEADCPIEQVCEPETNRCAVPTATATATSTATPTLTSTATRLTTPTPTRTVMRTSTPTASPTATVITCVDDEDCPNGSRCEDGICVPIPCVDDSDCPPGSQCEDEICVPIPCVDDQDCPPGSRCEDEICEPIPCTDDEDCPPASRCEDEVCVPIPCVDDGDCPPGSRCEDEICEPIPCTDDSDCPPTATCDGEQCVPIPCEDDKDCPPGSVCTDEQCTPLPCTDDEDCPTASVCEFDQCVPIPCSTDEDCPSGTVCDTDEQFCVPGKKGGGGGGGCQIDRPAETGLAWTLALLLPVGLLRLRRRACPATRQLSQ